MKKNNKVKKRFNSEINKWKKYHTEPIKDIIGQEIQKRKSIIKNFLEKKYKGKNIKILEIGCGAGNNLIEIANLDKNWETRGVDISDNMINYCKNKYKNNKNINFGVLNIEKDIIKQKFDVIILLGVVGYLDSNERAFQNINKMLKKNGDLLFTFGNKKSIFRKIRNLYLSALRHELFTKTRKIIRDKLLNKNEDITKYEKSHFNSYKLNKIKKELPNNLKIESEYNLIFSSGIINQLSLHINNIFEKILPKKIKDKQAFTKLLVVNKQYEKK